MTFASHPILGEIYLWSYGIALTLSLILTLILVKTISKENWLTQFLNKLPISTGKPAMKAFPIRETGGEICLDADEEGLGHLRKFR